MARKRRRPAASQRRAALTKLAGLTKLAALARLAGLAKCMETPLRRMRLEATHRCAFLWQQRGRAAAWCPLPRRRLVCAAWYRPGRLPSAWLAVNPLPAFLEGGADRCIIEFSAQQEDRWASEHPTEGKDLLDKDGFTIREACDPSQGSGRVGRARQGLDDHEIAIGPGPFIRRRVETEPEIDRHHQPDQREPRQDGQASGKCRSGLRPGRPAGRLCRCSAPRSGQPVWLEAVSKLWATICFIQNSSPS